MFRSVVTLLILSTLAACTTPPPREVNRFQSPPPAGSDLAIQLDAIPSLRRRPSGHYEGLNLIVAQHFPIGSSEELLIAFLNREGFRKPIPPHPQIGGSLRGIRFRGDAALAAIEERKRRKRLGTSLTWTGFSSACRFGSTSSYKVVWRARSGIVLEIYSDVEVCFSPSF